MIEDTLNTIISMLDGQKVISTDKISDGQHTFGELYDHRAKLFASIYNVIDEKHKKRFWKSKQHDDGTMFPGYFIVGVETPEGQATYHYELSQWDIFDCAEVDAAPAFDGHTPEDAINRIYNFSVVVSMYDKISGGKRLNEE